MRDDEYWETLRRYGFLKPSFPKGGGSKSRRVATPSLLTQTAPLGKGDLSGAGVLPDKPVTDH